MEITTLKAENLKPIFLKAGVPLALSLAGVIYAWIITKKTLSKSYHLSENESEIDTPETRNFHHGIGTIIEESVISGKLVIHDEIENSSSCLEQENIISSIRSSIEDMKMREFALNLRFERYCDMKEQEFLVMEIKNMLELESAHVEFLDREVQSLEAENMRLENLVLQYLRVVEKMEYFKSDNRVMQRKIQKLMKKSKGQFLLIKEQKMKIKEKEEEFLRNHDELKTKICVINKLEDEIKELQEVLDKLQDEKNQVLRKLDSAEKEYESKIEEGYVKKEDYNQILSELEQIKKKHESEAEELILLRWTNACLKHDLNKNNQQEQQEQEHDQQGRDHNIGLKFEEGNGGTVLHYESDHELHQYSSLNHISNNNNNNNVHCFGSPQSDEQHGYSKRKRLLRRLKRWVEGSEKMRVKSAYGENHHLRIKDHMIR